MSRTIFYKTPEEIELIQNSCLVVSKALARVAEIIKPGVTGKIIDAAAEEVILDFGAKPAFKGYNGFPNTLCISPNAVVVHGIPTDKEFQETDIVSVDCGAFLNGYFGDCAYTFAFSGISEDTLKLLKVTNESLYLGIEQARVNNKIGDIGSAIQEHTEKKNGYGVVRALVGHGVGRNLHEAPEVPNYGRRGNGLRIQSGLVIAIEPMINMGIKNVVQANDGWTIFTQDMKPSAHYEHTVAVTNNGPIVLSSHDLLKDSLKNNKNTVII